MKSLFTILLLILVNLPSFSQRGEKLESLKVAFLTNKLDLDAKTAERFWPLYHQYENELMVVVQEKRRMNQNETRNADEILDQEQKALDIKRKYNDQFSRVISGEQLNRLYRAEKDFRQIVINRSQKGGPGPNFRNNNERPRRLERNPQSMEARPQRLPAAMPRDQQHNAPQSNFSRPQQAPPPARSSAPEPSVDRKSERMRR